MKLVIVESPAKAKTIGKFLGRDYRVVASYGHVRDLPQSADEIPAALRKKPWARLGVDVDNGFSPCYVVQKDSKKHLSELKKLCAEADAVILATDEDREGESISWHLLEELKPKVPVSRIAFHEITKSAIDQAMASPRSMNDQLVRAQETRRILDRLFGYELSPVLWKKVRTRLSAGRVQSVAVRLVVEREEERRAFHRAEYWDVQAALSAGGKAFTATLTALDGQRIAQGKDFDAATGALKERLDDKVAWLDADGAAAVARALQARTPWRVAAVEQKEAVQRPLPPYTTSSLQQAASSVCGFSPRQTMQIAQRLYEGVDLGSGEREGLITYMRTDSVVLSEKALQEAGAVISRLYGPEYHHRQQYTTKSKMAQEAHEAIRPTHLDKTPEAVAPFLKPEELKLYRLVWNRTIASQMAPAKLFKTAVDFHAEADNGRPAVLRANGSVVTFPGFLRLLEGMQKETELPPLKEGMTVGPGGDIALDGVVPEQHCTQPPARFTEASLVKRLEEEGIGRPSTYAPTISTIQAREYVERVDKALAPTYLGIAVTLLLRRHFGEYVDVGFTARMEDVLDSIAEGGQDWQAFLHDFYFGDKHDYGQGLKPQIAEKLPEIEFPAIPVGDTPDGEPLVVRLGKGEPFLQRGPGGEGNFATIPRGLYYDELTVERALEVLETKAKTGEGLGADPVTGLTVYAFEGRFGPYVQLGFAKESKEKVKRASLPKGTDVGTVTMETALKYLSLPRTLGAHPEKGKPVMASIGPYGPYVGCDGEFRSLPKNDTEAVFKVDLEGALALLSQPKGVRAKQVLRTLGVMPGTDTPVELYEGRYGPYVTNGDVNATLPKDTTPEAVTLERALELIAEAEKKPRKPARRKAAPKKAAAKKPAAKGAARKKKTE